jgi:hypothetical protein
MTLVAALSHRGQPVLLGDLLLSAPDSEPKAAALPTVGDPAKLSLPSTGSVISGLSPKLHIIHDGLAIGVAGSMLMARRVVEDLRLEDPPLRDLDDLRAFFAGYDQRVLKQIDIVGACAIQDNGTFRSALFDVGTDTVRLDIGDFGDSRLAGTGAATLAGQIQGDMQSARVVEGSPAALAAALARSLGLAAANIAAECATGANLVDFWGGGLELIFYADRRFQRLDGVTYLVWVGKLEKDGIGLNPHRILKTEYHQGQLVIRCQEMHLDEHPPTKTDIIHCISEFGEPIAVEPAALPAPDFNSTFICNAMFIEVPGSQTEIVTQVLVSKEQSFVRFQEVEKGRGLLFSEKMMDHLNRSLRERLEAHGRMKQPFSPGSPSTERKRRRKRRSGKKRRR